MQEEGRPCELAAVVAFYY